MQRGDTLLCSINDRLGALCRRLGADDLGVDLPYLDAEGIMNDLVEAHWADMSEQEDLVEEHSRDRRQAALDM